MITEEQIQQAAICIDSPFADSLEQAKALLEYYEQSRWIAFDENDVNTMPEHNQDVLCYIDNGNGHYSIDVCTFTFATRKFYIHCCKAEPVTHWQPLPPTPEED